MASPPTDPGASSSSLSPFGAATRAWFDENFATPTGVQTRGWPVIARGEHALLVAPTGSGKTLAAFLWAIDRLTREEPRREPGVRIVYVSPLKALVYDIERNLRAPLAGIARTAERLGESLRPIQVDVRTGDTPQKERQRQSRDPGDILVTTPESLFLVLGARARETLAGVQTVIVDEVHALAPNKRGAHLALSLERLSGMTAQEPQRIGLSATVRPLDEVARFLGGDRQVEIVDAAAAPNIDLTVCVPVPDMQRVDTPPTRPAGGSILGALQAGESSAAPPERGLWPVIYPQLLAAIRAARSTIVFVNSRGLCERLCQRLNELAEEELVRAHHGSVSHDKRTEIEEGLKSGTLRGIVATSSLELGIDMGAVEQVLLVESPGSVARGLQRVGRAGHGVGEVSKGNIYPKFRGDLLECAVVAQRMQAGEIEALQAPRNALDVLAQQIVAICSEQPHAVADVGRLVRRSYSYGDLSDNALTSVLDMLSGSYPSSEFADLRPRLSWDRANDLLSPRRGTAMLSRMNAGTIPDRGYFGVHLGEDGPRVGELDEEMVFETRAGEVILLGASSWRVEQITRDRVIVTPAPGEPGRLPFWRGDGPGRPVELGNAVGAFVRELGARSRADAVQYLSEHTPLDAFAAENLTSYVFDQKAHTGTLPTDRDITIERFRDELGDWRVCILTPFGARLHAPWAMALQQRLAARSGFELQVMYTDDGIVLRFADAEELPDADALVPDPDEVEELITEELASTSMFASLFRENAVRSLLLTRNRPDRRNPLWAQRLKARELLAVARGYPGFPIVLETYRQVLSDVFDLAGLKSLLRRVRAREIHVHDVETRAASPFARSLVFAYVAAYLYEQDSPLAERKAQALTLDRDLLRELLGQAELRELLDPGVLAQLEEELQGLAPERQARDADELHDLLRRIGDLDEDAIALRTTESAAPWFERLRAERRAVKIKVSGLSRWIAAEDAGLYRDALGAVPPAGLPAAFLAVSDSPFARLIRRYARTHGPFLTREPAAHFGVQPAQVEPVLTALEASGQLVRGELRPGGVVREWCDAEILRRLKRRTLARLRDEVAPVEAATLGRFLTSWHGIGDGQRGPERLETVIAQLEGVALPWSMLNEVILPARVTDYRPPMLDMLCASGAVVWVGRSPLGTSDGRVALYRRAQAAKLLSPPQEPAPAGDAQRAILDWLESRGASFLAELNAAVEKAVPGIGARDFRTALWDLVWAGYITNDTFAPLRTLGARAPRRRNRDTLAGGRWSLVAALCDERLSDTERAVARASMLLERYGVVSREAAQAEELPGGFGSVYKVLRAMEESGRIRRGHFVEGLSGAQFAHAGAVDRLRASRVEDRLDPPTEDDAAMLAAQDPANPYGSLLSWPAGPAGEEARPRRVPGAWVILVDGMPRVYVSAGRRHILTFGDDESGALDAAFRVLHRLPRTDAESCS